jgi:phenylacetate-CoA ligase
MSKTENLYRRLPNWAQNAAVSCSGWWINHRRYNKSFQRFLQKYQQREFDDQQTLTDFRDRRLRDFLQHAVDTVPLYQAAFQAANCNVRDIRTLADLDCLPILDKAYVQAHQDELNCDRFGAQDTVTLHTSGSTGAGLRFPATIDAMHEQWAVWWRYRESHGITRQEKCLYFGGRSIVPLQQTKPPYWRYNRPGGQILFSGYHLSPETAKCYIEEIRRSKILWMHGYPSQISLLGQYAIDLGMQLPMRWVTLGAEGLLANQRKIIQAAFGVDPIQHYGMAEGVANISQCPAGKLHVDEDYAAVEFIPCNEPNLFRVVGTGFVNLAFPLIRYDVGDVVSLSRESCDCGRQGRLVSTIDGRQEDFVVMKNGVRLGRMDHIFKDCINVKEAQLVQSQPGAIEVCVVKGLNFSNEDEQRLRDEISQRVGEFLDFQIIYLDKIPRTNRGKLRFVVSTLEHSSSGE